MKYRSPVHRNHLERDKEWGDASTLMGFLRSTMKLSARCIKNRVNLWHRIRSISSACLILMLTRIEFTEGSMNTRSFSFRDIVSGFRSTSLEPLRGRSERTEYSERMRSRSLDLGFVVTLDDLGEKNVIASCRPEARDGSIPEMGSFPVSMRRPELI